jgi:hypothetical protein
MFTWSEISNLAQLVWLRVESQLGALEMYTFLLIGVMIAVWIVGATQNGKINNYLFKSIAPSLTAQFASPGVSPVKESNAHFFSYSTGRRNCGGMSVSVHLSPRQDFLMRFVFSWFSPSWYKPDTVQIEITSPAVDSACTFLICRKFQTQKFETPEIKKFAKLSNGAIHESVFGKSYSQSGLTGFACLADAGGRVVCEQALSRASANISSALLDSLEYVSVSRETKSIKVSFSLATVPVDEIVDFTCNFLLDSLASVRVADSVRTEIENARNADSIREKLAEEKSARDEAAAKKAQEQRAKMTPHEIEKQEEKERKRQQKKQLAKGRMML